MRADASFDFWKALQTVGMSFFVCVRVVSSFNFFLLCFQLFFFIWVLFLLWFLCYGFYAWKEYCRFNIGLSISSFKNIIAFFLFFPLITYPATCYHVQVPECRKLEPPSCNSHPPGIHHCRVGRGSMEWEFPQSLLHMTNSGNQTPDL